MLLPNKLFSYSESILAKLPIVLKVLEKNPCSVHELYKQTIRKMAEGYPVVRTFTFGLSITF